MFGRRFEGLVGQISMAIEAGVLMYNIGGLPQDKDDKKRIQILQKVWQLTNIDDS